MSTKSEAQLADIGKRLAPSQPKDALLKLLKQAAVLLQEVEQSPPASTVAAMKACTEALVLPSLLRHKDKDVKLLVASCISEIMRIVAPEAPYEDDVLKDIFNLIVTIFQGLNEVSSPSFPRRVNILETVAKVRSCVVMLDLECDDLILEMFHVFFNTASEEHPQNVFVAMRNILALVLEESEEVSQPLLEAVLTNLLKDNKGVSPAAHKLAVAVVERCADKLEPYVQKFLTSVMLEGKGSESELQEDYHAIIYEIYRCARQMLIAVIPNLIRELVTDQVDVRLKAVELLGRLFALSGQHVAQEYKQLFSEFLKRFSDKAVEVRLAVVACAKACLEANPSGPEATDILAGLDDRLLDFDDKVRMSVVESLCDLVNTNLKWVPMDMIRRVADRLRDKKVSVRKYTLQKLAQVYRTYTSKCKEGSLTVDEQHEWIPSKIVRCAYDKDFRPQGIEIVFTDELFSADLPIEQRAKHWVAMLGSFDKNDEKAFRNILGQKLRLQMEMQNYLTMRQKSKEEDTPELQKKIQACFKAIAASFVDATKAEENFQKLHQMKDNYIFKSLNTLLSPSTLFAQAQATRDELLKRIGEKHPQHDFIKTLATKCSFLLFNKEHVKAVLKEVSINKLSGNKEFVASSLSLLVEFAGFFPALLEGTEGDLLELLKESDESIKEGVVHILAKAGGSIRDQIADKESAVDLTLEQLCLEGSRKQAKHAVSAIAAISADSGLKALSVLYGRLVDLLDDLLKAHLPTILQSLGCIAEIAMPVFETREEEVVRFVVRNLLKRERVQEEGWKPDWENPSEECLLKIYGLKVLVKSFLPIKDSHLRTSKLKGLLGVVAKLLTIGEVSEDIKSSDIDKANLRLATGKAVLRLARRWDQQISPNIVQSTLLLAHDPSIQVRQKFLLKVHQYSKERSLHQKYACVFALVAVDPSKEIVTDGKRFLADFVETCRREARSRQVSLSGQIEGTTITYHPEYVLTYLVHVLAHEALFPADSTTDVSQYELVYRQLLAFLRALVHQDGDGRSDLGKKEDVDNLPAILAIFRSIKNAEDLVEKDNSKSLHTVCDIGILITKDLGKKKHYSGEYPGSIPLPAALYKVVEALEGEEAPQPKVDGSHLPSCFSEKDVLTRFRTGGGTSRAGQPASPRGHKRERRSLDEDSSSDEGEKDDEGDPQSKKVKHSDPTDGAVESREDDDVEDASLASSKPTRGRKKSNGDSQKNGMMKLPVKQKKDTEEVTPKRKRGRPAKSSKPPVPEEVEHSEDSAAAATKQEETMDKAKGKKLLVDKQLAKKDNQDVQKTLPEMFRKKPVRGLKVGSEEAGKDDAQEGNKRLAESTRSPAITPRKAPQRASASAVEKTPPTSKVDMDRKEEELIGCKIKVWWPLDKRYYRGTITHYDAKKKKHRVIYDDDEVENLILANEQFIIFDSSKAPPKKVTPEKAVATPSGSGQSGKLKRKAAVQTVDNGSQSPGPSDKKRATTPKGGKDSGAHSLQGVGRGLAQAKSGSLSSPTAKNSKRSASISAGPFAFSDEDLEEPANEKGGGKQAKGSSAQSASKGITNIKFKRKADSDLAKEVVESEQSKEKAGKEKLKEKVENEKPKEKVDKDKAKDKVDSEASKERSDSDRSREKTENEKLKTKADTEKEKSKSKAESEKEKTKEKVETEKEKAKAKADLEKENAKLKAELESQKAKAKADLEKAEKEKAKVKAELEKAKAKAEAEKAKLEAEKAKSKPEAEKPKAKVDGEKPKSKPEAEKPSKTKSDGEKSKGKADGEKTKTVELDQAKGKAENEKPKEVAETEKLKGKVPDETVKAKGEAVTSSEKADTETSQEKVDDEKPSDESPAKSTEEAGGTVEPGKVQLQTESEKKAEADSSTKKSTSNSKSAEPEAESKKDDDDEPLGTWRTRRRKLH
ncbi:sister chromatid cohesion protein PDS5 [Marchantia polymorpha subsp. ruderalis]|uniref:Tudor domain-containing protein n=2 Tax=Marchantia polymorpha TaxID=3197 RepID=A0AAF6B0I9_MARPO|nr:hypothetical protein MARPO_0004s0286 [Marchantia polymorpha]BBN05523.1 hypothetical protein Mp_3g13850 [Marchantia polymorpha subsp. ruderalis]|eukprot:PTQ49061.1 hypothetical protein MARPO_0004s0286 [Marchantia polymorpha]